MKKTLISVIFVCFLSSVCSAINISADCAVLYEPETKTVVYEKNMNKIHGIASTTKIMTCVAAIENADLNSVISVPQRCTGIEGTSMYLKPGEKLSLSDLLYGMMLASGNDAALTIADYIGKGNTSAFVKIMNDTAQRIGMKNTFFKNPNGLPADGHYSTAYDMSLLAAYAMKKPEFRKIVGTKNIKLAGRKLSNHNKLLAIYDGANGIKTGFTKSSGRCLVSSAKRNNTSVIAVTLGAPDDWNDHKKLFDYFYSNYELYKENASSKIAVLPVVGGEKSDITVYLKDDINFLLKKEEKEHFEKVILLPKFVYAPVQNGDCIGKIQYKLNGKTIKEASLTAESFVEYYHEKSYFERILDFFRRK